MRRFTFVAVLAAAGLLAAACGGSSTPSNNQASSSGGPSGTLTLDNESGGTWTCDFNPFNLSDVSFSVGNIYEPLVFVNALQNSKTTPWLATSWAWGNGDKQLTFTIRTGVKFSNGTPLTAADVVYSFNLIKQHKTMDINSVWSVLSSVTQQGSNKVVMTFKAPAVPYFYYIGDQTPIVSKAIWSKIANPVTYPDKHPVGTGSYTMSKCTPQNITYTANRHYWQPGLPKVETVNYPAFLTNDTANTFLANGQAQWGSQFIPSIQQFYTSKNPSYHYWFPPIANVTLFINLTNPILKNVAVRQAMAYAINRQKVSTVGEYGYEPASNQTGIVTPTFSSWLDQSLAKKVTYDPKKAESILKAAGYKKSGGVYHTPSGKALSFRIINIGGYSDWVASVQVIQQQLKAIGIKITAENLSSTTYTNDLYTGSFQLAYSGNESGGPAPYYELRQLLYSKNSAPIGKLAASNWERYYNPQADALINAYAATTSSSKQHDIVGKLQALMVRDIPVIPVTEGVDWYQYNTKDIAGWVTQGNKFAKPAAYEHPDWGVMLLHLKPKG
jgi:peptide/nickel transport system substrate-binding protein